MCVACCVLSSGELEKRESDFTRLQRARLSADDFEPLTIIGRGAFGEVRVSLGRGVQQQGGWGWRWECSGHTVYGRL